MFEGMNAAELRALLGPITVACDAPPAVAAYQRFYGLDLPHRARVQRRLGKVRAGRYEVVLQAWLPDEPKATVLVLHGYYDHMGLYRHAVDWALARGFAVLGCDLPGHGLSDGAMASIDSFEEYQRVLDALLAEARALDLPSPWHLLGQSTGGAILIDRLLLGEPIEGCGETLLFAPLVRPRAWGWSRVSYALLRRFVRQIPRRYSDNSGDPDFLAFVRSQDRLQSTILPTAWVGALAQWIPRIEAAPRSAVRPVIIQGEADMTVDWRHNLRVLDEKFDRPEVLRLGDARHHLVNERADLRRRLFDHLDDRLG